MRWVKRIILSTILSLAAVAFMFAPAEAAPVPVATDSTAPSSAWTWDVDRLPIEPNAYESQVSVDGDYLCLAMYDSVWLLDLRSRQTTEVFYTEGHRVLDPKVSGHYVVWSAQEFRYEPWYVYVYDVTTRKTVRLPQAGYDHDVYYGQVVWAAEEGVYLYDAESGESTLIGPGEDVSEPRINDRYVVWKALTNPGEGDWDSAEIFLYDLQSKEVRQLTSDSLFDHNPRLGDRYIVWERGQSENLDTNEICLYSLLSGTTIQITADSECDVDPQISDGIVVWTKLGGTSTDGQEIYLYDARLKKTTRLTDNGLSDWGPTVSGDLVAWSAGYAAEGGSYDIYVYDLATKSVTIVGRGCVDVPAPVISDEHLFWLESVGSDGHTVFRATHNWNLTDVDWTTTDYWESIQAIAGRDIIRGFPDGTFRPEAPVTRQQFAKMIAKAAMGISVDLQNVCPFADVASNLDKTDPLYPNHYVGAAVSAGLIKGYPDGTYRPSNTIARAQVVTMVVRAAEKLHPGLLQTPLSAYRSDWGDFDPEHGFNARKAEYNGLLSRGRSDTS